MTTLEILNKIHFFSCTFALILSDCCIISTLLTHMIPSVLMQFINVPFQITLSIPYRPTHLKAFVLSNVSRHINRYHEKVYVKTVDKLHQKRVT